MKRIIFAALALSIILTMPAAAAEINPPPQGENAKPKHQVITKKVTGEVAGISKNFIAVDYKQDEKGTRELALDMDKKTNSAYESLEKIKVGDIVAVTYDEISEVKEGQRPIVIKRLAKLVEFHQAARVASGSSVLQSGE